MRDVIVKRLALLALATTAALPGVAFAQAAAPAPAAAPAVAAGATVYDTAGGVVGTVASTDGTNAVIDTGTVKAAIPVTSLGAGAKGPVLAMTKAQLEAAAGQQQAQASAEFKSKLVPGAAVYGAGGTQLGTIKAVAADGVTVTTTDGDAKLPAAGFGPGPQGVTIGMTAEQLKAAMSAAAPAAGTDAAAGTEAAAAGAEAPSTPGTTEEATSAPAGATTTTTPPKSSRKK